MKLEIINDIGLDISFEIIIGTRKYLYRSSNKSVFYELNYKESFTIRMLKENIWEKKGKFNSFFLKLYSLDLTFGNLSDSENLPYSIDKQITIENPVSALNQTIFLSDIVKVEKESLYQWKKNSFLQSIWVSLLIVIIGIILSFIFESWIKIIFLIIITNLAVVICLLINNKRKKLFNILKTFMRF